MTLIVRVLVRLIMILVVRRLVMLAFGKPPPTLEQVIHEHDGEPPSFMT